jgi:hypothetical protein
MIHINPQFEHLGGDRYRFNVRITRSDSDDAWTSGYEEFTAADKAAAHAHVVAQARHLGRTLGLEEERGEVDN